MILSQDQDTVSVYFTKLKTIWEELSNYRPICNCGKCTCDGVKELNKYYQTEYTMSFLMGLNDSYSQIRGQILLMDPLPQINKVFALISQEENQRKISTQVTPGNDLNGDAAFGFKANTGKGITSQDTYNENARFSNIKEERNLIAHIVIFMGTRLIHVVSCMVIYQVISRNQGKGLNTFPATIRLIKSLQTYRLPSLIMVKTINILELETFCAKPQSKSIPATMSMLSSHLDSSSVTTTPDHDSNGISYAAGICYSISVNPKFLSKDLWIMDSGATRHFNLLSISALRLGSHLTVNFFHDHFVIQDINTKKTIGRGSRKQDLYILDAKNLSSISSNDHFSNNLNSFDLVHYDIWGPYQIPSYTRHGFFVTIVDDCSKFTWLFLLKQKSDATVVISRFFSMFETQFHAKIKVFRSDNAPELAFKDFFAMKGVLHQFSCVERPQQNSVVERKHQHLLIARALYFQSKVPIHL
ncbi:uncharacterized protein LOC111400748 [Olea europaea var. sylvestris]|uniref:uncharacterized protein LOC111400748 n=1 Tax=Olea europaea var. sylvestris TaxID=158386 RepID=UPI000C1CDD6B|nr:uncharacterized protein LOC111400748 [Olea europaea var. sylvestris]